MRNIVKWALLAGLAGATYGAVKAYQEDGDVDKAMNGAVKEGVKFGLGGAGFGLVLSVFGGRRAKRKVAKTAAKAGKGAALAGAARAVGQVAEAALEAAQLAALASRPRVEHAVDVARPKVEHAIEAAVEAAKGAAKGAADGLAHASNGKISIPA